GVAARGRPRPARSGARAPAAWWVARAVAAAAAAAITALFLLIPDSRPRRYNPFMLERELRAAYERIGETSSERPRGYLRSWYAPKAARELLGFRPLVDDYANPDVLRVVLALPARAPPRPPHSHPHFPRQPQLET